MTLTAALACDEFSGFMGIVMLDTRFFRLPGDIGHPDAFGVPVRERVVPAGDTEGEAWHHFSGRERWKIDRNRGALSALPSPEEVTLRRYTPVEQAEAGRLRANARVGSGLQIAAKLRTLANTLGGDELVVITWTHDPAARRRSYELLAQ